MSIDKIDTCKSDAEILAEANALARGFAAVNGYEVPSGYDFSPMNPRRHLRADRYWRMAQIAFERLCETDLQDIVSNLEDQKEEL